MFLTAIYQSQGLRQKCIRLIDLRNAEAKQGHAHVYPAHIDTADREIRNTSDGRPVSM